MKKQTDRSARWQRVWGLGIRSRQWLLFAERALWLDYHAGHVEDDKIDLALAELDALRYAQA